MTSSDQNQTDDYPQHITCFVALPFKDSETFKYETVLLPALRSVLELDPYYWQVVRADQKYFEEFIQGNVGFWMKHANAYIADISDLNPNVMMELGYMLWAKLDQPLLVLKRSDVTHNLADLGGFITISYPTISVGDQYSIMRVAAAVRGEFAKHQAIQKLNRSKQAHYLSPLFLSEKLQLKDELAERLSQEFITMQNVRDADENDFRNHATACGLPVQYTEVVRKSIIEELQKSASTH